MGKVKELDNAFKSNYHGILSHDGELKVAGYNTSATIKYINRNKNGDVVNVLIKGTDKNYIAEIHKDLKSNMMFCDIGDTGFIKFRRNVAWLVGFRKSKEHFIRDNIDEEIVIEGDADLLDYFQQQSKLSNVYESGVSDYEH